MAEQEAGFLADTARHDLRGVLHQCRDYVARLTACRALAHAHEGCAAALRATRGGGDDDDAAMLRLMECAVRS